MLLHHFIAVLATVAAGGAIVLAARLDTGDGFPLRDVFRGGVEVTRYGVGLPSPSL